MRFFLPLILAVLLSLNAAHAAATSICDALEHTQGHGAHFAHHSHEHGGDHSHKAPLADPGQPDQPPAADHHHAHVHQGFSVLLSAAVDVIPLGGPSSHVARDRRDFASAPQLRLDRPPRPALA